MHRGYGDFLRLTISKPVHGWYMSLILLTPPSFSNPRSAAHEGECIFDEKITGRASIEERLKCTECLYDMIQNMKKKNNRTDLPLLFFN